VSDREKKELKSEPDSVCLCLIFAFRSRFAFGRGRHRERARGIDNANTPNAKKAPGTNAGKVMDQLQKSDDVY